MSGLTRRELLKAAGVAGAAAALPSALAGPAGAQGTQKRELVVAQGGDISKFDPHFSTSANDIRISFNLFDNLIARHPDGKLQPSLATDWKLTNPTTWTFKLRHGVKWHNGDPFSSADVKYSFERTWDPKQNTRVSTEFTTVHKVEAPDASTVVFTTKKPDPLLSARVAFYGGQIVPRKYPGAVRNDTFNPQPGRTGAGRFGSWREGDKVGPGGNPDCLRRTAELAPSGKRGGPG